MSTPTPAANSLCALWISPEGGARQLWEDDAGHRYEREDAWQPFGWSRQAPAEAGEECTELAGDGPWRFRLRFPSLSAYGRALADRKRQLETVRPLENQYLLDRRWRLFGEMPFARLRRLQLDIETACAVPGGFSDPTRSGDRVLAIGLWSSGEAQPRMLTLEAMEDGAEKALLERFEEELQVLDPDVIEGHNIFQFDLRYLRERARRFRLPCAWGRFGQVASFRPSRLRVAERSLDFLRCDLPGRTVFDTWLAIQTFDVSTRELPSYGLKEVAISLGLTPEDGGERTYLPGHQIQEAFHTRRDTFLAYLADDLRETRGVADRLLPTYFAQARTFPMTLQEAYLRGSAAKVDLLLLERYAAVGHSLPESPAVEPFEGGFTRSYATGVFRHVLHFDVASLYPSLLLLLGRNPPGDRLGVFIPLLRELRQYRLHFKNLARQEPSEERRAEYQARQQSYKVLINSFYGYLGFSGARFADGALAAEVTRRGRELLQAVLTEAERLGARPLEADTDGVYLATESYYGRPEELLAALTQVLPEGIDLEFDGRYPAMFCYKAKNYALFDGHTVTVRGSALRSRGIEPFLKDLTRHLLTHCLHQAAAAGGELEIREGGESVSPRERLARLREEIASGRMPIDRLARSEYLNQAPEAYQREIESGGKPRRAALEVALTLQPPPRLGERVRYYITARSKGRTADWQRARAVSAHDPATAPYDPTHYLAKLDDWEERFREFLGPAPANPQGELF